MDKETDGLSKDEETTSRDSMKLDVQGDTDESEANFS